MTCKLLVCVLTQVLLYQVVFEGIRGNSYQGDIAIDDITFTVGACVVLPHNAVPTLPPTQGATTGPPTAPPPGKFDCNFEVDFCTWKQEAYSDKFNWTRQSGRTSSTNTGPTTDHTLKTGKIQTFLNSQACAHFTACVAQWSSSILG